MIPYFDLSICTIVKTDNCIYSFEIPLYFDIHEKIKIKNVII